MTMSESVVAFLLCEALTAGDSDAIQPTVLDFKLNFGFNGACGQSSEWVQNFGPNPGPDSGLTDFFVVEIVKYCLGPLWYFFYIPEFCPLKSLTCYYSSSSFYLP